MNITLKTKVILKIVHALRYIHNQGLIYRYLKIGNAMLNRFFQAKVIDFGMVGINECLNESILKYCKKDQIDTSQMHTIQPLRIR